VFRVEVKNVLILSTYFCSWMLLHLTQM